MVQECIMTTKITDAALLLRTMIVIVDRTILRIQVRGIIDPDLLPPVKPIRIIQILTVLVGMVRVILLRTHDETMTITLLMRIMLGPRTILRRIHYHRHIHSINRQDHGRHLTLAVDVDKHQQVGLWHFLQMPHYRFFIYNF